ncbi:MAG: hypothetical protein IJ149_03500 [Oscillospiraceae bacterium]|nr:hypothetical protein [Oscillospiraceae bacterium]
MKIYKKILTPFAAVISVLTLFTMALIIYEEMFNGWTEYNRFTTQDKRYSITTWYEKGDIDVYSWHIKILAKNNISGKNVKIYSCKFISNDEEPIVQVNEVNPEHCIVRINDNTDPVEIDVIWETLFKE